MSKTCFTITVASLALTMMAAWGDELRPTTTATTVYSQAGMRDLVASRRHTARCRLQAELSLDATPDAKVRHVASFLVRLEHLGPEQAAARASEFVSAASSERDCRLESGSPS